jgi:hypothetical protein
LINVINYPSDNVYPNMLNSVGGRSPIRLWIRMLEVIRPPRRDVDGHVRGVAIGSECGQD